MEQIRFDEPVTIAYDAKKPLMRTLYQNVNRVC